METSENKSDVTVAERFKATFPSLYEHYLNIYHATIDIISSVNDSLPWWFELQLFLKLLLAYECALAIGNYSFLLLSCVIVVCCCVKEILYDQKNKRTPTKTNGEATQQPQTEQQVSTGDAVIDAVLNREPLTTEQPKKENPPNNTLVTNIIIGYVVAVWVYCLLEQLVRLVIFLVGCRKGIVAFFEASAKLKEKTWYFFALQLGIELTSMVDAPEAVLVTFFNKAIVQLWPYASKPFNTFVTTRFPEALQSSLRLVSAKVFQHPFDKDSLKVTSAKVNEANQGRIVIDVNILYLGNYVGFALWPSGDKFRFRSFQVDAKLRLDFKYTDLPAGYNLPRNQPIGVFEGVNIRLKKLNKLDTWHEDMDGTRETSNPSKKRFLNGAEGVIQSCFPLDLLMVEPSDGTQEQPIHNPIYDNSSGVLQRTITRPPSSQEPTADTSTSPLPSALPSGISATSVQSRPVTTTLRPSSLVGAPQASAVSRVQGSRPLSVPSSLRGTDGTVSSPGTHASTNNLDTQEHIQQAEENGTRTSPSVPQLARSDGSSVMNLKERPKSGGMENIEHRAEHVNRSVNSISNGLLSRGGSLTPSILTSGSTEGRDTTHGFGSVELTIKCQPPRSLVVTVHKLRDLPKSKGRTPNSYVKLILQTRGRGNVKESTSVLDKTADPVFEKSFQFQLNKLLSEYTLTLRAKTKHTLHHALAQVLLRFGPSSSQVVEERVWYDLSSPNGDPEACLVEYQDS